MTTTALITLIVSALLGSGGLLTYLASRGAGAQNRYKDALAESDKQTGRAHLWEDYAGRLRKQLSDAGITPEAWPDDE